MRKQYIFLQTITGLCLMIFLFSCGSNGNSNVYDKANSNIDSSGKNSEQSSTWISTNEKVDLDENLRRKNYMVVFDNSGSMKSSKCSDGRSKSNTAKDVLGDFAKSVPKEANLGLIVFDDGGINVKVPLGVQNRDKFISEVNETYPGGGTPLHDSIDLAYNNLRNQAKRQLSYGEYHLVVITDGDASPGQDPKDVVKIVLNKSPIIIHTIGFCIEGGHALNQPGKIIYKAANSPDELRQGLEDVLAESQSFDITDFKQ